MASVRQKESGRWEARYRDARGQMHARTFPTKSQATRWAKEKQAAGLAPKTLQKIRLVLRQILETARGSGAIKANPCQGLRLPRAQQKEPIFLTAEQVDILARSARPPYDLLIRFAAATGLRPSELCGLR